MGVLPSAPNRATALTLVYGETAPNSIMRDGSLLTAQRRPNVYRSCDLLNLHAVHHAQIEPTRQQHVHGFAGEKNRLRPLLSSWPTTWSIDHQKQCSSQHSISSATTFSTLAPATTGVTPSTTGLTPSSPRLSLNISLLASQARSVPTTLFVSYKPKLVRGHRRKQQNATRNRGLGV